MVIIEQIFKTLVREGEITSPISRIVMNKVSCKQVLLQWPQLKESSFGTQKGVLVRKPHVVGAIQSQSGMIGVNLYTQKAIIKVKKSFVKQKLFNYLIP